MRLWSDVRDQGSQSGMKGGAPSKTPVETEAREVAIHELLEARERKGKMMSSIFGGHRE